MILAERAWSRWASTGVKPLPPGERSVSLDLGRILAALAVIYVHSSGNYLWRYDQRLIWNEANFMCAASRFCVPLFIMMSGALVLARPIDDWVAFMKRRSAAILKPYVFATLFYLCWQSWYQHNPPHSLLEYSKTVVDGVPFFHLYFLWLLLGLYFLAPLLSGIAFVPTSTLVLTTLTLFILSTIQRYLLVLGFELGALRSVAVFVPYFVCGYIIVHRIAVPLRVSIPLFLLSIAATTAITVVASAIAGRTGGVNFEEYDSLNVIVLSVSLLCILQTISIRNRIVKNLIHGLAKLSLGIFILHFAFLVMLFDFVRHFNLMNRAAEPILLPIVIFLVCAGVVRSLHFIPRARGFI